MAKLLHSLTDDNPDLQKQIGCMTGIFQLFDRQHILTDGRRIVGHSPRRLPSGNSHLNIGTSGRESNNAYLKPTSMEKYTYKNMQDRQRVSTESSRVSFSSSSLSSSFSSPECNRATQLEQASFNRMIFPETPSGDPSMSQQHPSPQFSFQTIDLRDFVKDSMYREIQGLSVKAKTIQEAAGTVAKYRDSPRLQSKISYDHHGSGLDRRQRTPADLKESLRVLAKLQEVPKYHTEPRELLRSSSSYSKDGLSFPIPRDAPRLSYDGREINRTPFDSADGSNSSLKLKDLPRLSLDGREGSIRGRVADSKSKDSDVLDGSFQSQQQQTPGNQARPPSVVAKLMGLEMLPGTVASSHTDLGSSRIYPGEDFVNISSSYDKTNQRKPIQLSSSSKNSWKEPSSPHWRSTGSSMKPMSRFPIEPAPWKQIDGSKGSQKAASRSTRGPTKAHTTFPSVYSEIEKRLKDLEFTQSGKDLRALKQILEAMQAKGFLETSKEEHDSNVTSPENHVQTLLCSSKSADNRPLQTFQVLYPTKRKITSAQKLESSIVIMKPVKVVEKSHIPAASIISLDGLSGPPKLRASESIDNGKCLSNGRTSKGLTFKSNQRVNAVNSVNMKSGKTSKMAESSARSQQLAKEGDVGLGKSSGSNSPRLEQKKRSPSSPGSSKPTRQSNRQQSESNSPGGRRRIKHQNSQKSEDQLNEVVESRNLTSQDNEGSTHSNSSAFWGSKNAEVLSSEKSPGISSIKSPSMKDSEFEVSDLVEKKSMLILGEDESAESGLAPEYSSPVSVLDNVPSQQDSASPIRSIGRTLRVDASICDESNSNAVQQSSVDSIASSGEPGDAFKIDRKKLQNIDNLVEKLKRLNSSHDEARTDYIASLCENTDPDHRYVSEILLASGLLLRDLGSSLTEFQFHPSGHPINPELFLVLEQTKASTTSREECSTKKKCQSTSNKVHRKLIFDLVNEILAGKLAPAGSYSERWIGPLKPARKSLNAQKLLRELCSEIDGLGSMSPKCSSDEENDGWKNILGKDVMQQSENRTDFNGEISGAVLDIERMIFKDLVSEIVIGESAGLIGKPARQRLLAK